MPPLPPLDFSDTDLALALRMVQAGGYATSHPELTPEEKAIIYYYTHSNACAKAIKGPIAQADGTIVEPAGLWLQAALAKLPLYVGLVYSAEQWPAADLQLLLLRQTQGVPLGTIRGTTWPNFMSSSTSKPVAVKHFFNNSAHKNCLLRIFSRSGRYIDALSRFGINGQRNDPSENEVLFLPSTVFRVVSIKQTSFSEIELLEL